MNRGFIWVGEIEEKALPGGRETLGLYHSKKGCVKQKKKLWGKKNGGGLASPPAFKRRLGLRPLFRDECP